jgi:protein-tyrosine-phosphatase/predicted ATP-grasp superfamily ATP-dependent carboligase
VLVPRRVLVLDGDCNAAIAIVQSLGRAGYHVTLAGTAMRGRAFLSRYVADRAVYPDPLVAKSAFQDWATARTDAALIVPATDRTLIPLHEVRDRLPLANRVALPPPRATELGVDKEAVRALAARLGIPVPDNAVAATPADLAAPRFDAWLATGAIVLKTMRSKIWSDGRGRELQVRMVCDREQLAIQAGQLFELGPIQLQRWLPGHGVGVEVLVDRGELVMVFAHERLHELPLTGGGSCYRRAIAPPPELVAFSARLLRELGWHGVAMVEFRWNPATKHVAMMELNGRFWGSLPLATFAGVDFPRALVELLLDGRRPAPATPRLVYARQFGRDLTWLQQMARLRIADLVRRGAPPPSRRLVLDRPLARSLLEWGRIATGRETWDGAALDDPLPIAHEIVDYVRDRAAVTQRLRLRRAKHAAVAAWRRPLGRVDRVLVLCNGNICRSPYAGVALDLKLRGRGVEVRSGGFVGPAGRPAPAHLVAVAARRGVELAGHRSHVVDDAELAWADLVLIMDHRQELVFAATGRATDRLRWLGGLVPRGRRREPTIVDPIDFGAVGVAEVLDHIDACIDRLVERIVAYHDVT